MQAMKRHQARVPAMMKTSLLLTLTSVLQAPVAAQTLNEVVVSASRASQRSFDAPAAIQSVDRATIEGAGAQVNLSESLNRVPGLTILSRQNYAQDLQVSIRGFGARSAFGIRGIRLLVDGIPATTPDGQGQGSSISLTSTERMEVLRGPLAQMYGNSSGGVIQAFTRDAPATPELLAAAYTGSFGLRRTDWQYAGRVGRYGLVADYSTFDIDGFRDNSRTERKQFNGKLSFDANEATRVNVVFNRFDMPPAQDPAGLTQAQMEADPTQAPSPQARPDVTAFQIDSSDEIVVASSSGGSSTYKNAPGTRRTGWELSGSTWFRPRWRASLAASQIDASYAQAFTNGATAVAAGNKMPGIPQSFLFSELVWTQRPGAPGSKAQAAGSQAGIELTGAGRLYANDTNTASADGYATLNLKASHVWVLAAGQLTTCARMDNLTDKRYVGSVIVNQAGSQFYEPAPGRNWTLGVRLAMPL
ncbi:MAG: TonB-dependent receptor plug domain-containing protein [Rhodoferax sp.]|uniref:TonB-dependent receptor plug domain-containing protein n=1 Tax=Rhodoferax sp. TaxID=50421 RepID=UPI003BB70AD6